jgi:hypothetical protein
MESWDVLELRHARLGDARLNWRLVRFVADLAARPTGLPSLLGLGIVELKACWRWCHAGS